MQISDERESHGSPRQTHPPIPPDNHIRNSAYGAHINHINHAQQRSATLSNATMFSDANIEQCDHVQ